MVSKKGEERERIAPPLGASAVTFHHSTNSLQHKSLTSGEGGGLLRPSQAETKESLMEPVVCWVYGGLQAWDCRVDTDAE